MTLAESPVYISVSLGVWLPVFIDRNGGAAQDK
jgi:hypothetical protein